MSQLGQTWDPNLYQSAHAFVWRKAADLLELLAPKAVERILDLGSGTGQLTAKIAEAGAEATGIDRSQEMVAQARRNFPQLRFDVGDATTFALEHPVDAVFSNATLHWVKPPEQAIARIWHALKPGGRFVAEFGGKGNVGQIMDGLTVALREVAGVDFDTVSPWYYPSIAAYAGLLEREGFSVTFATLFGRPTPLEGGPDGLRNWLRMFGGSLLSQVDASKHDALLARVEQQARPALFGNGTWSADYVRLRVVARKPA
jgi:trans-aconitate 2-methyltransferase